MSAPLEIERKYIIKIPAISDMAANLPYTVSEITQTYLQAHGLTHRVRRRETSGKVVYTETRKIRIDQMSAVEDEREISADEYERLLEKRDTRLHPINKVRHTFFYKGHTFEVDVYPFWQSTCVLETELSSRDEQVEFPEFIEMVKEVTGNKAYSNHSLAFKIPSELE